MEYVTDISREEYESFLAIHPEVNFLQSWQWGETHETLGDAVLRSCLRQNGQIVAVWTGIVKNARRGRYLEVPGGPVMDWSDDKLAAEVIKHLKTEAKAQKCVFVRLRPQVIDSETERQRFASLGLRRASFHLHAEHTNILDVQTDEEALLANMRRQTRYEVRRVAKRGVEIHHQTPTKADIDEFYDLQQETAHRHNFVQSPREFFYALVEKFGEDVQLYRATKDGKTLNLALVIHAGEEADYYEAASSLDARKEPGAYGIVWQAIQVAKSRGQIRFNFWGIAYTNDPHHRYAGVTTFKRGFGGEDVAYIPAHDIVIRPTYLKTWLIETIRKKRRKL